MRYLFRYLFRIFTLIFLLSSISCRQGALNNNSSKSSETYPFLIHRYEVALFSIDPEHFESGIEKIAPEFRVFLGDAWKQPAAVQQLKAFVSDPQNKQAFETVMRQFPDLSKIEKKLHEAYTIYLDKINDAKLPITYTYISGYDFELPVKFADSIMIIALDMYLGEDYDMYKQLGIPLYISQRLTPDHILSDCMKELALARIPQKQGAYTLLDAMIEQGKMLYFEDITLPDIEDRYKIGYSSQQLEWCRQNEANLWQFMIENELLYSTESRSMSMFMVDGPFTSSFSQESPARTGAWLGWQIVRSYMDNNRMEIRQLFENVNAQEILEKSGYKPRKI